MKKGKAGSSSLEERIISHEAHVVVVGLGYVGLPLAVELAQTGFPVTGYDVAKKRVEHVNAGKSDILDVKDEVLGPLIKAG